MYIGFEVLFSTTDKLRDLILTMFTNAYVNREGVLVTDSVQWVVYNIFDPGKKVS